MTDVHDGPPPLAEVPPPDEYPGNVASFEGRKRATPTVDDRSHDDDAERQVLAAAILDDTARADLLPILGSADFYDPRHEVLWDALAALVETGRPVDAVSVGDYLRSTNQIRQAGGIPYLATIISGLTVAANATYHAEVLQRHTLRRSTQAFAARALQLTQETVDPVLAISTIGLEVQALRDLAAGTGHELSTWQPIDLSLIDGTRVDPDILRRADGIPILYSGRVHAVVGEPESGKSWVGLYGIAQLLREGTPAAMIDFEDEPNAVVRRLLDLGVNRDDLNRLFRYIRPDVALTSIDTAHLERAVDGCGIVLVDGVTEAMTMHNLSLQDNEDIARFLALIPRRIADLGPAVLQVDHVIKDEESRGRYALGGGHKLAGITGAQFKVVVTEPFGRGKRGQANVLVDKDREGGVRQHTLGIKIAELVIDSRPTPDHPDAEIGPFNCYLNAPDPGERTSEGEFRPTVIMGRICDLLKNADGATKNAIEQSVQGKASVVRTALNQLVAEGYVTTFAGARGAIRHHLERHIDETADVWAEDSLPMEPPVEEDR